MSMNGEAQDNTGIFTRERILTIVLAVLTTFALYSCYLLIQNFIPAIAFALALAIATARPFRWLLRKVNHQDTLAAGIGVVIIALLIVVPFILIGTVLVQQALASLRAIQEGGGHMDWRQALRNQPQVLDAIEWLQQRFDIEQQLRQAASSLAGQVTGFLGASVGVITQLVITLFVLFFLYRDRREAMAAVRALLPLSDAEANRVFARVASTIQATVNGSLTVAATQACLAGAMYAILGVPAPVLWGAATFLMALVPVFGTFSIWGPMSVFLALSGSWVKALILVGWGLMAVGTIDNILYPYLVGDKLRLHTVPTFFAILGGITAFGPAGLILGPLTLAITIALIDVWWRRTTAGQGAEETMAKAQETRQPPGKILQDEKQPAGKT